MPPPMLADEQQVIAKGQKTTRIAMEAAYIGKGDSMNVRSGKVWSRAAAQIAALSGQTKESLPAAVGQ